MQSVYSESHLIGCVDSELNVKALPDVMTDAANQPAWVCDTCSEVNRATRPESGLVIEKRAILNFENISRHAYQCFCKVFLSKAS